MNSIQPAAHARAVTGFRDSEAGTRSIAHCAWNRSLLWLLVRFLPVVILSSLSITPAQANGGSGTITNGQPINGTITGQGVDTYTFNAAQGATFVISLGETGNHYSLFRPQLEVRAPGQTAGPSEARPYYTRRQITNAAAGNWTIIVSRLDSDQSSGGSYALKLAVADGGGAALTAGQNQNGTNARGGFDVYSFTGTAGQKKRLTLTGTGGAGFVPEVHAFGPDGADLGSVYCDKGCSMDVDTGKGTYTTMVWKNDDNDVTGSYSLSVSNAN
jgi:hypothetical protein